MPSTLVIGGAGRTGRHIVDRLRRNGAAVKVLSRNPVMVSQIYITRPEAFPAAADVIAARGRGEQALRDGAPAHTIARPSWLTDDPGGRQALRLEQGDTGDGRVARADVADAVAQALTHSEARGKTFALYGSPGEPPTAWARLFAVLR